MHSDTIAFGAPLLALAVGAAILVGGLFAGGFSLVSVLGGAIVLIGVAALALAVARAAGEEPSVELEEREGEEPGVARGAK
ncbi:hypothetical protein [Natronococcus jeotgali]|uniref:Uncharacterized protein n=1 Tax=Natronococcus jeotgali DSM 18795 TaxID=1227498 RepID=L9WNQ1_9EURY|nr:hypothetical protein [Natronococcus jeotgali]ELY50856.1 hypothetical protein C492_21802 [Natronococcus jeotgali DSM 18795]